MDCKICIERDGDGYEVCVTNPDTIKSNQGDGPWQDPMEEYDFDTWDEVKAFLDKIVDKALPASEFNQAFAKAAKEVTNGKPS